MKIKLIIDNVNYQSKPKNDIGTIINRMTIDTAKEYSIEEIKQNILDGKTNRPAYCGGKESEWVSQQVFMIDIDNEGNLTDDIVLDDYVKLVEGKKTKVKFLVGSKQHKSYDEIIEHCKNINLIPNFVYTSFNHKEEQHKYRLVFILDKVITDFEIAKKIQLYLMHSIGEVDEQCKNLNRPYFAGKAIVFDSNNLLNNNNIIEDSKDIMVNVLPSNSTSSKPREKCPPNNKEILVNSIIIRGTKTPTTDREETYTIKAISNRDVKYLKGKYGSGEKKMFNNNKEFMDYIRKEIDLGELLEFNYPKSIRCIFHEDNNNSASIFQSPDDGAWIYHCFGCGVSYNILGVIEMLGKFKSRPKAYKFIREIFNLEMKETEWQKEQKELIDENLRALDTGELELNCPQAYKNIKSNLKYIRQLLYIAKDNVSNEKMTDEEDNVVFFASNKFIAKELKMNIDSSKEISKKTTFMSYHKLLNKLDDSEVSEDLVKRSRAISINSLDKNKKYRHVNYYSIPSYNNLLFTEIEEQGKKWKENNYTIKGLSREMFYRTEGKEISDWLYPQYKQVFDKPKESVVDRTTTTRSDKRTKRIVKIIFEILQCKNYVTEKEIVDILIEDEEIRITKGEAERQLKKSLKEILDSYGLKRIRANKEIKEQYGMDGTGYPFIIVNND